MLPVGIARHQAMVFRGWTMVMDIGLLKLVGMVIVKTWEQWAIRGMAWGNKHSTAGTGRHFINCK
jgi:hypothetical protein